MPKESIHASEGAQEIYGDRSLERTFPSIIPYLFPGAEVLDVGCGPGTITIGVAEMVRPGTVVAIDLVQQSLEKARKLASELQVDNVSFRTGDTLNIDCPDESFDITYSRALIDWVPDPLSALKEQKRVTKRNGLVITQFVDWGSLVAHPQCPCLEKAISSLQFLNDPSDPELFFSSERGRTAFALFSEAGFQDIDLKPDIPPEAWAWQGSKYWDTSHRSAMIFFQIDGPFAPLWKKLFSVGALDEETLFSARKELEEWHNHPHGFRMQTNILAVGRIL